MEIANGTTFPPPGFVDRREAARMLGVVMLTLKRYVDEGKVPRGQWFVSPEGRRRLLYSVDDLARAKLGRVRSTLRTVCPAETKGPRSSAGANPLTHSQSSRPTSSSAAG